jgi:polyketide cyclase/dehydrase/lipid transport protein
MLKVTAEERIERSQAEVFRFVASDHFVNHPRWDPDLLEMVQTSSGPVAMGTTARVVRRQGRRRIEGIAEVTAYEPDRLACWDVRFGSFHLVQRADFIALSPAATTLGLTIETHASGVLRLALPLMRRQFEANVRGSLRRIRELVEDDASTRPDDHHSSYKPSHGSP